MAFCCAAARGSKVKLSLAIPILVEYVQLESFQFLCQDENACLISPVSDATITAAAVEEFSVAAFQHFLLYSSGVPRPGGSTTQADYTPERTASP